MIIPIFMPEGNGGPSFFDNIPKWIQGLILAAVIIFFASIPSTVIVSFIDHLWQHDHLAVATVTLLILMVAAASLFGVGFICAIIHAVWNKKF